MKEQALATIEQALNLATTKGAFTLADVEVILSALSVLKNDMPVQQIEDPIQKKETP